MRTFCLTRSISIAITLLLIVRPTSAQPPTTQTPVPTLPRVFIEDTIGESRTIGLIRRLGAGRVIPLGSRLTIGEPDMSTIAVDRYLDAAAAVKTPLWIAVNVPTTVDALTAWRDMLRRVFARHADGIDILEIVCHDTPPDLQRFAIEVAATEARAQGSGVLVAASGADMANAARLARQLTANQAPYLDLFVVDELMATAAETLTTARRAIPGLKIVKRSPLTDAARFVRDTMLTVATDTLATAWDGAAEQFAMAIATLTPAANLLSHATEEIDPGSVGLTLTINGADVRKTLTHRLLFDGQTFAPYLWYDGGAAGMRVDVALQLAISGEPAVYDLTSGRPATATGYSRDEAAARTRVTVPVTGASMLVDFSAGASDLFIDRSAVTAARVLSVQEVIARHRQQQTRQDALLRNYRAHVRMEQHFRPSLTDAGYDVVTENEYFVEGTTVEWEEYSFSVNGSKWGSDRPAFPLLQAEKVLSLPLELRLNQDYRYELASMERIGEIECYRVRFEPTTDNAALYKGTVWIDRRSFAKVKVQAVQTRTVAPIVSNEEIHTYEAVAQAEGTPIYVLTAQTARQIVLIAGRNLLLEKASQFSDFRINDASFAAGRAAARQGERIMYRDTDQGVRYLVKQGDTRVVSDRATTRAKAMAIGALVDPSFAFPLPIFGINYLNFEVAGRSDTQLALLFGGVLAAGNVQRPKIGGTPLDASVDFFGIAAPTSDRLHLPDGERPEEALLSWPLSAGVNLGWQYTAFQKATFQYQLRFEPFVRDRTTAESFVVPSSTTTHGLGATWEYRRGGYSAVLNGTWYGRAKWAPWGPADALETGSRTYDKYAAHISKDIFLSTFQKVHMNAAYFGGARLDRFSRYQFGLFDDTRIHGVPASGVRFDDLAMVRGSYSFNIVEQYRLDLFLDQAWGRDRSADRHWRPLTGLGAAVNLRAPFNTILRGDVGKSFLPARYDDIGSLVFQVMILKPLK
jgi:hypothetical protein